MPADPHVPRYYVVTRSGEQGPLDASLLKSLLEGGEIQATDNVRTVLGTPRGTVTDVMREIAVAESSYARSGLSDVTGNQTAIGHPAIRWPIRHPWAILILAMALMVALVMSAWPGGPSTADLEMRMADGPHASSVDPAGASHEGGTPAMAGDAAAPADAPANQDVIAIEDFNGSAGGMGWAGAWGPSSPILLPDNLYGKPGAHGRWTSAGAGSGDSCRRLPAAIDGGVFWLSVRMRMHNFLGQGGLTLMAGSEKTLVVGASSRGGYRRWMVQACKAGVEDQARSIIFFKVSKENSRVPAQLIVRCAIQVDRFITTFWVDPSLEAEPAIDHGRHMTIRAPFSFNGIAVSVDPPGDFMEVDDIRIGRTWRGLFSR